MDHPLDDCVQCGAVDEGDHVDGYYIESNRAEYERKKAWDRMTQGERDAAIRDAARVNG